MMYRSKGWLDIVTNGNNYILLEYIANLKGQDIRPELVLLIGGHTKRKAAKDLFGLQNSEEHGTI